MDSLNTSLRALLPILEELGTPRALSVAILLREGDLGEISSLTMDLRHYLTPDQYYRDRQATDLLKKVRGVDIPGVDRRAAALNKWWDGERRCYRSNERLSKFNYGSFHTGQDLALSEFFSEVRKTIREWIGSAPPNLDKVSGKFGPGATFSDRGRLATVADKMTSVPTLTSGAAWYTLPFLQTCWGRITAERHGQLSWVRGNRYLTVPKTCKIDRSIAVEPSLNVFYQLALGTSIRNRLNTSTGWDLDRAQDIHRQKAKESSVTREFATLDLSNASDTVSIELVRLLLPPRWFEELYALRSPFTRVNGKWCKLEKFSSMGNGYTFELETLIFAALCSVSLRRCGASGCLGEDLFVFGDDLIIPDRCFQPVVAMLKFCGFEINQEKSFHSDVPFRESCGGDYFDGFDVRPFYLKELKNDPWDMLPDCNGVRSILEKLRGFKPSTPDHFWQNYCSVLPSAVRECQGPKDLGDIVIHNPDWDHWRIKWKHCIRYFKCVIRVSKALPWHHWHPDVVLACALYGVGDGYLGITPRDPVSSYKVAWVPYS